MSRQEPSSSKAITEIARQWPWLPYVAPFAAFAGLTYLLPMLPVNAVVAYLVKTIVAGALLALFWPAFQHEIHWAFDGLAVAGGVVVFLVWIGLEGRYPQIGHSAFDPHLAEGRMGAMAAVGIRLLGASLVVPLIEEVFWRSFVMRFLTASPFTSVPLGTFSVYAFGITALAFGFEHHRWLPGIAAGIIYGALLCRTRNLFSPIQAHAVTNFLLGLYVIQTGQWSYW